VETIPTYHHRQNAKTKLNNAVAMAKERSAFVGPNSNWTDGLKAIE
jgi:hypothetical protein